VDLGVASDAIKPARPGAVESLLHRAIKPHAIRAGKYQKCGTADSHGLCNRAHRFKKAKSARPIWFQSVSRRQRSPRSFSSERSFDSTCKDSLGIVFLPGLGGSGALQNRGAFDLRWPQSVNALRPFRFIMRQGGEFWRLIMVKAGVAHGDATS
jgi:hypothetical protein